jgi:hypothetical protein
MNAVSRNEPPECHRPVGHAQRGHDMFPPAVVLPQPGQGLYVVLPLAARAAKRGETSRNSEV